MATFAVGCRQRSPVVSKPTAAQLMTDWQDAATTADNTLRTYRLEGKYMSTMNGAVFGVPKDITSTSHWRCTRDGKRFLWDITDGAWEWNLLLAPKVQRNAVSFDGERYYYLIKNYDSSRPVPSTAKQVNANRGQYLPSGYIETLAYMASHLPQMIDPQESIAPPVDGASVDPYASKPEKPQYDHRTPEEPMHHSDSYAFEPVDILKDPVNSGVSARGVGDLIAILQKQRGKLQVTTQKQIDGKDCWCLSIPLQTNNLEIWTPIEIWFYNDKGTYKPVRFVQQSMENIKGFPETVRVATIKEQCTEKTAWWPCKIESLSYLMRKEQAKPILYSTVEKSLRLSEVNQPIPVSDFRVPMPNYAIVIDEGKWRKMEPMKDIPKGFDWSRFVVVGYIGGLLGLVGFIAWGIKSRRKDEKPA